MELLELRYFLEVAKAGSFSRASTKLGLTQPALSRQIQKLERELGGELFYRHGRGAALTEAGRRLRDTADPLVRQLSDLKKQMLEQTGAVSGRVSLGIPPSVGGAVGARLADRFRRACPEAQLRVHEGPCGALAAWIEDGHLDVAVMYDVRRSTGLLVSPLASEDLYLVQPAGSAPASRTARVEELRTETLVLPGPENGMRRVIDAAASAAGVTLSVGMEIDSLETLKQLVEMGSACTILPYGAVHADVPNGGLVARRIDAPGMTAHLVSATPVNRPVSTAARALLRLLRHEIQGCGARGAISGAPTAAPRPGAGSAGRPVSVDRRLQVAGCLG